MVAEIWGKGVQGIVYCGFCKQFLVLRGFVHEVNEHTRSSGKVYSEVGIHTLVPLSMLE
jgi:hypothetical protein